MFLVMRKPVRHVIINPDKIFVSTTTACHRVAWQTTSVWAVRYTTRLLVKTMQKGAVFSFTFCFLNNVNVWIAIGSTEEE